MRPHPPLQIVRLGESALVAAAGSDAAMWVQRRIWKLAAVARTWNGVKEAVAGMNNLTLFVDAQSQMAEVETLLRGAWAQIEPQDTPPAKVIEIPVRYGGAFGPDLAEVARVCKCSENEVVSLHAERDYDVYFLGFQPGFAYLGDLDERLRLPRRAHPRTAVAAGSVAVAERMTCVYPARSPGGWHVIGSTLLRLFDARNSPPALLSLGERVRFVPVRDR